MKKRTQLILGTAALLLIAGLSVAGVGYYLLFAPQFYPTRKAYIYIDRDDTADSVYHKLALHASPRRMEGLRWLSAYRHYPQHIHTGRYAILPRENAYHVFSRLYRGYQEPVNLTIGSVRTVERMVRNIERQLMIDSVEVAAQLFDSTFLATNGYSLETLPCLFIPNTYQVYWDVSAADLLARLQKEHDRFWKQERREKAQTIGLTPNEVATLASIVEEETNNAAEKPMVAGLYLNRLRIGMPLQADPTVKFALQDFTLRRITHTHLEVESPYNTYRRQGLPPGPIRIPTIEGIDAVLNHAKHNYLYMCAKEDFSGTHNFAATLAEHQRNAQKYWAALNRRKIFK
ncbi:MAG: endolytic transglycosylase MltG [Mediterranea sp.]|nr:endolytic transglycosylase MltG [Mediterranea sp.]